VSLDPCNMVQSGIKGVITLSSSGRYQMWSCFENGDLTTPVIDVAGDGITKTLLYLNEYSGRVILKNMTSVDEVILSGNARVTIDTTCTGGLLCYSGDVRLTDNSGNVTLMEGDIHETLTSVQALNDFNPSTDAVANVTLVDTVTSNTDMRGTNGANTVVPDNASISSIEAKVDSVLTDTSISLPDLINALENISAAEVKAQLVAALSADVTIEPTNVPSATAPISDKLGYLFAFAANKTTQTSSTQTLRNFGDTLDISSAPVTSDGITTTRGNHT
ncbi:MAG: hypothetical protein NZ811_00675, partial [Gammaproteobacteria bacterium]|nr:hypothetical protein [Gammaproteobacteria bacterium]